MQQAAASATQCKQEHASLDGERRRLESAFNTAKKVAEKCKVALSRMEEEHYQLEREDATQAVSIELAESERAWRRKEDELLSLQQRLVEVVEAGAQKAALSEPLRTDMDGMQTKYNELAGELDQITNDLEEARAPLTKAKTRISTLRKNLDKAEAAQDDAAKRAQEHRAYIEQMMPIVRSNFGERVPDKQQRTAAQLKQEQVKLGKQLQRAEAEHGGKNLTQLAEEAHKAKMLLDKASADIHTVQQTSVKEKEAFTERSKFLTKEAKTKGKQAASDFNARLSRKGHAGSLDFDHGAETLSLSVTRNSSDQQSSSTTDARNLSGGERSFTTLAFELAMWEFCATPFRVLDEFDVFMDDTYRKQAVDTLMELCDTQPHRQFLFITPQDMHPFLAKRKGSMPQITKMRDVRPE